MVAPSACPRRHERWLTSSGTETDTEFKGYSSGNTDPGRGFGHIAITVPNIEEACARFEKLGVNFKKRLTDGKMRNIAFILYVNRRPSSSLLDLSSLTFHLCCRDPDG